MLVDRDLENVSFSGFCIRFRPFASEASAQFLSLYFRTPLFRRTLSLQGKGTNINNLSQPMLKRMRVPWPPKIVRQYIAEKVGAYDRLIDNNRKRIELLEQAGRLLYREWFVYYRFPGHEHLKLTDGLPANWERRTIEEMTDFLGRGISPTYDDEADFIVVNQKCIRNRMLSMALSRRQRKIFKPEKALRFLDVLINSTGTGTLGRVAQCWFEPPNTTFDSHVTVARPNQTVNPFWFGYALLDLESIFEGMGEGATNQKELGRDRIANTRVIVPSDNLQQQFGQFSAETTKQIQILSTQNEKLVEARDLLLPRLMTGEIAV